MATVRLHNNSFAFPHDIERVYAVLIDLWEDAMESNNFDASPVAQLFRRCKNPKSPFTSDALLILLGNDLIGQDGRVSQTVYDVVLSAIRETDNALSLVHPRAKE